MMDEIEHGFLDHIPPQSLALRLARATIKMNHGPKWRVDKINPVHDLIVCTSGSGTYQIGDDLDPVQIGPGEAILIPAYTRFRGAFGGGDIRYTGLAQHFSLELFGKGDVINQMRLRRKVTLPVDGLLEPLARSYQENSLVGNTTLTQHHQFMVLLLAFIEEAFLGWKSTSDTPDSQDHLSVQIMLAATRLAADPLGSGTDVTLADIPYNRDYFRRAFRDRLGYTPKKFRELKRMQFAANRLGMGLSVKAVSAELGYSDPYFFSRMFKRYLGSSPSTYRDRQIEES